jgi:predicted RNA-binding protein with PIN domain
MPSSTPQAILLVDGYNVVGAWHSLKRVRDRYGLEEARRELADALADYSASYLTRNTKILLSVERKYQETFGFAIQTISKLRTPILSALVLYFAKIFGNLTVA